MFGRKSRVLILVFLVIGATSTVAFAATGSVSNARSVVFYYGETSGNGKSDDFSGSGDVRMCANSDGGSKNTFAASYYHKRFSMIPDKRLKYANVSYSEGLYRSGSFSISSSKNYYTRSDWSAVPSLPNNYSGYVSTRYNSSRPCA
jgi:hypothetical protein